MPGHLASDWWGAASITGGGGPSVPRSEGAADSRTAERVLQDLWTQLTRGRLQILPTAADRGQRLER